MARRARQRLVSRSSGSTSSRYTAAVRSIAERVAEVFATQPNIAAVYLFGSTARGTTNDSSDVDIGVLFTQPPSPTLSGPRLTIEGALERALGVAVDLVVLNDAPVDLRTRVLRDGQLLIDRDRSARIAFEVRSRNEAFDLEPMLQRYRTRERP
jgi:predicted nucleotidyltransferase